MALVETEDLTDRIRGRVQMLDVGGLEKKFPGALGTLRPRTETTPPGWRTHWSGVQVSGRRSVGGAHSLWPVHLLWPTHASPCWAPRAPAVRL